jgi:ParB family chromosome partitioning protein
MTAINAAVEKPAADKASEQRVNADKPAVVKPDASGPAAAPVAPTPSAGAVAPPAHEKRRALGRGLDSLLPSANRARTEHAGELAPGPRAVMPIPPVKPTSVAVEGATTESEDASSREGVSESLSPTGRAGTIAAPSHSTGTPMTPSPLGGTSLGSGTQDEVLRLPTDLIDRNPYQTRRSFNEDALKELAQSIKTQGILQPLVVRHHGDGRYLLILGERRLRASQMAGMETVPAIVKRVNEQQAAEMTVVENLQRQDLNCVDQAAAFANLSQNFKMTQEEIGKRVGLSREAVANYMRLLSLPEGVLEALIAGRLTYSHARALMPLKDEVQIWSLAKRAMEENLKVSDVEDLVKGLHVPHSSTQSPAQGGARWVDPNVKAAQRSLEEVLGMRVRIRDRNGRGKIVIEYSTIDDFDRVVEALKGK